MNLQYIPRPPPIRVMLTNPLVTPTRMFILKLLTGVVFGPSQVINLIFLVYENERDDANLVKLEMESCAFNLLNTVDIMTDLPKISDADVFCFMTNFDNPNQLDFTKELSDDEFDSIYLLTKIAHHFSQHPPPAKEDPDNELGKKDILDEVPKRRPLFITDGLVGLDILMTFSKHIEYDTLFAPTCIRNVSRNILAEYLKVNCESINRIFVWAANDEAIHVEINTPIILTDVVTKTGNTRLVWLGMSSKMYTKLGLDPTTFNANFLKTDFKNKVINFLKYNPYGPIYKATAMARALKIIWSSRAVDESYYRAKTYFNSGVISDGNNGTIKGLPYVLPVMFMGDTWTDTDLYSTALQSQNTHSVLMQCYLKKINCAAIDHHQKLMRFCKKFWTEDVIGQHFIPSTDTSFSVDRVVSFSKPLDLSRSALKSMEFSRSMIFSHRTATSSGSHMILQSTLNLPKY